MPFTVTMPKLSPTMESGTVVKWRVKEGSSVKAGDVLIEVATDKATVEFNAIDKGFLRKIIVQEGKEAVVNQAIAIFTETADESIEGYQPEGVAPEAEKKAEIKTPTASAEKTPTKTATAGSFQQPAFTPEPPLEKYDFTPFHKAMNTGIFASPYAKKLAEEVGVDLSTVQGSGPQGRVMARDIEKGQPDSVVAFGRKEIPEIMPGSFEEEKLSPMRKVIGQRLQESKTFIPHFYVTQEINAEPLVTIREQLKKFEIKVSFNDFIVRAAALSLREHPTINSGFNTVSSSIIRYKTIDIAIAVSMENGLITPILRHADYKNLGQISTEIKALAAKARAGKLSREEYMGGSFTISNLGMYGVSEFIGVINPPQAAILCVGGLQEKPVIKNKQVVPGQTMALTLCSDHRVIDGSDAAKFLASLKQFLENPALLLVN